MGLHHDYDKSRSDLHYETKWAEEREERAAAARGKKFADMLASGDVVALMSKDEFDTLNIKARGGYVCYATAKVEFFLTTATQSIPVQDAGLDSYVFVRDRVIYVRASLPEGVLGINAQHCSYNRVCLTTHAVIARGLIGETCTLHSEEQRRAEAVASAKATAAAELEAHRESLAAAGWKLVNHQFRAIGRKTKGQIVPFVVAIDGAPTHVFTPESFPAENANDFVVLVFKKPNYGEWMEIAVAPHATAMHASDVAAWEKAVAEKASAEKDSAEKAAIKQANSPFAGLAKFKGR